MSPEAEYKLCNERKNLKIKIQISNLYRGQKGGRSGGWASLFGPGFWQGSAMRRSYKGCKINISAGDLLRPLEEIASLFPFMGLVSS